MKVNLILFLTLFLLQSSVFAQESGKRSKSINFEDEMVEGINRKNLDSFNQISEQTGKNKNHLYRKRAGFNDRDLSLLTELRLSQ